MSDEMIFFGKPVKYWLEIEATIRKYVIDEKLFTNIVLENYGLRIENSKLKERLRIIKEIAKNIGYTEFDKLLEECE